jgi:hypothetical protein
VAGAQKHQSAGHWRAISSGVQGAMTVTVGVQNAQVRAARDPDRLDSQADSPPGRTLSGRIATWTTLFSCQGAAPKGMIIGSAGLQFGLQFTLVQPGSPEYAHPA